MLKYLLFSLVCLAIMLTIRFFYSKFYVWRNKRIFIEVTPPAFTDKNNQSTEALFASMYQLGTQTLLDKLLGHKHVFSAEILSTRQHGIRFLLSAPEERIDVLEKLVDSYVPDAKVKQVDKPTFRPARILEYIQARHYAYPLMNHEDLYLNDPLGYITSAMTKLKDKECITYQLILQPVYLRGADILRQKILRNEAFLPNSNVKNSYATPLFSVINKMLFGLADAASMTVNTQPNNYSVSSAHKDIEYKKQLARGDRPARTLSYFEHELVESVHTKLKRPLLKANLRIVIDANRKDAAKHKKAINSSLGLYTVPKYQSLKLRVRKVGVARRILEIKSDKRILNGAVLYLSANELASLYHFPHSESAQTENVVKSLSKTLPAPVSLKQNENLDVLFGENLHHGQTTAIGLTTAERERHMYIIGGTGNGKTTMLKYMITQDIQNNKGVAVVDPHGDLAEELLGLIPEHRVQDVVYINPDDLAYPIGINLLELNEGLSGDELLREKDLITESTISVLRKLFSEDDSGGHRIEYVLRNTIQTALTVPGANLFTIFRLLNDSKFRKGIVNQLEDHDLKIFWKNELGKAGEMQKVKMAAGITAKIGRFLFSASAKRILEQEKSTINFDTLMDEGKIVVCNFSKGLLGEDTSMLFGVTVLAKLQLASLRRARLSQENRRPFYVYVDEFQNFATMSFVQMLSEARKYKLYLTMAEQSTQQQQEQRLVDIILANVATVVAFRSGSPADARLLIPLFSPYIEERELANLPAYNFYCRISAIHAQEPLSGVTVLLDSESNAEVAERVRIASRTKYAKQITEVSKTEVSVVSTAKSKPRKTRKKSQQSTKRGVPKEELIKG